MELQTTMRKLEDKNTGLIWLIPEVKSIVKKQNSSSQFYTPEYIIDDKVALEELSKELNQYQSDDIRRFVTGNCDHLGDFIKWSAFNTKLPCYCFEDGKLVATAVITPNNSLGKTNELRSYIEFCEKNIETTQLGLSGYISLKQAKNILNQSTQNNNTDLDYLVVIPTQQGKGIGTRAVHSITHNMQFFAQDKPVTTIYTQVHKDNTTCHKIMKKNNFNKYVLTYPQFPTELDDLVANTK